MNRVSLCKNLREVARCLDTETDYAAAATIVREAAEFIIYADTMIKGKMSAGSLKELRNLTKTLGVSESKAVEWALKRCGRPKD